MATPALTEKRVNWGIPREFQSLHTRDQISCLIVGEDLCCRLHIADLLADIKNLEITAQEAVVSDLFGQYTQESPDLAFIMVNILGNNPIKSLQIMRKQFPGIIILAIAPYREPSLVRRILMAGANGYLVEDSLESQITEAVRLLIAGRIYLANSLFNALMVNILDDNSEPSCKVNSISRLTEKEFDIFLLLGRGYKSRQIALETHFSLSSVIAHVKNIRFRLGLGHISEVRSFARSWVKEHVAI